MDACPRGKGVSRTLWLAESFLDAYRASYPAHEVRVHRVSEMGLMPLDGCTLARRESLIEAMEWSHPMFAPARDFIRARNILVAAPYWDLSFPAAFKVYVECIFIRELTFRYQNDEPIGLCAARRVLYLTTAGDKIGGQNLGAAYVEATFRMLGIPGFDCVCADGLDVAGANPRYILESAAARVRQAARAFGA